MMTNIRTLCIVALLALCAAPVSALRKKTGREGVCSSYPVSQRTFPVVSDTLQVQFRLNKSDIDRDFMNNGAVIDSFVTAVSRHFDGVPADSLRLDIYAGASPEGTPEGNRRLGERRGNALCAVLEKALNGRIGTIVVHNEASRWQALEQEIERSDEPWRDEVLVVLRTVPAEGGSPWARTERELRLRQLRGGSVWNDLLERYLPPLRSSGLSVVSVIRDSVKLALPDTLPAEAHAEADIAPLPLIPLTITTEQLPQPCWAVKTNLLLDGALAPNVAVEYPLGWQNRWSVEAQYIHPWWIFNHNARAEQLFYIGVELRYWLGNRKRRPWLDGHHIGLAAGSGYYDFEWKKVDDTEGSRAGYRGEGYQGEPIVVYVNYGWQHRFARHWAFDLGIGVGFLTTKYRHYIGDHDNRHLMWQNNGRWNWVGPVMANVSLVYTIDLHRRTKANHSNLSNQPNRTNMPIEPKTIAE